jgi:hypothetical protein
MAVWIFSRRKRLLLAATGTTSEMPGGMKRLIHELSINKFAEKSKIGIRDQGSASTRSVWLLPCSERNRS